jgi:hypothetical protein
MTISNEPRQRTPFLLRFAEQLNGLQGQRSDASSHPAPRAPETRITRVEQETTDDE